MIDNKRIAKNTLLLYLRMFLLMGISLYTSRIVLETLGVEDFGVFCHSFLQKLHNTHYSYGT